MPGKINFKPLTIDLWNDFEKLFGEKGACGGCWCMYWRLKRAEYNLKKGNGNKTEMKKIVRSGKVPGIIAYINDEPAGWCSFGERKDFPVLDNSRILKPVDDKKVWSIICFFIAKPYRKSGLSSKMLEFVKKYVKRCGGKILEGYPVEPKQDKMQDVFAWTGFSSAFLKAGFKEVIRRSETRPIMRFLIK